MSPNDFENLSFQGGGGKGLVYLGVVQALEKIYNGEEGISLFNFNEDWEVKRLKRISGASAGAITAFMLAIGMSSKDILEITKKTEPIMLGGIFGKKNTNVSLFEKFFEKADVIRNRSIRVIYEKIDVRTGEETIFNYDNHSVFRKLIKGSITAIGYALNGLFKMGAYKMIEPGILSRKVLFDDQFADYINSVIFNRGLFAGIEPLHFFSKILDKYLIEKYKTTFGSETYTKNCKKTKAIDITFADFFKLTQVDLVIMGTNVHYGEPRYFSVHHTPDMPVVQAVALSMSIPILFKPVYIDYPVITQNNYTTNNQTDFKKLNNEVNQKNKSYKGLYVDGGMLINLPIHAFDKYGNTKITIWKADGTKQIKNLATAGGESLVEYVFNKATLGFSLQGVELVKNEMKDVFGDGRGIGKDNIAITTQYLGLLMNTFMFNSTKGQLNKPEVKDNTIVINTGLLETTDFSSPDLDRERGVSKPTSDNDKNVKDMKEYKEKLIKNAKGEVLEAFGMKSTR